MAASEGESGIVGSASGRPAAWPKKRSGVCGRGQQGKFMSAAWLSASAPPSEKAESSATEAGTAHAHDRGIYTEE